MKRLRIGMMTLCYHPTINGVVRMIDLYKERFEALGHEVTIFTFDNGNESDVSVFNSSGVPLWKSGYYVNLYLSKKAQTQMAKMDILHCHHLFLTLGLAKCYGRCPIVYTNHTRYDLYTQNIFSLSKAIVDPFMKWYWPSRCKQADVVIAPSLGIAQLLRQFGVDSQIVTIENGISLRPFTIPPNPKTKAELDIPETAVLLVYVGRLSKEKNVSQLLHQFKHVLNNYPNCQLILLGNGPEQARLLKLCQSEKLMAHVRFLGFVSHDEVPNYLASADMFVTASSSEVHPLTLLEAMAAGLPIVAPDAIGNRDIVTHQITGLLAQSPNLLATDIEYLLSHPAERISMGEAGRNKSQRYTIEHTVEKTLELYQNLLKLKETPRRYVVPTKERK